ncbi:hypothetical protein TRFO_07987 [Tritrichomonas foetus]|uniref:DUF4704 domain-containing protein n=1 Tax=Tritrichomonas foetus TaxID=1144522 RepID=A0A1J4JMM7_9EUKA|nr:hypothetical protein TRFO_07987 [Tritrichomonas foetus]|eukprot:OHT00323.1 hypothetical protein TRFO_07987 [Tritrichomonas foetus]
MTVLSKFIKVIFPNFQYPTELYQRFLQICASDSSLSTTPAFKIRQVHALMYLVKLFLHTDMKVEIVEFCGKLCDYSQYNSFQCHKAQLDLVLLDKLLDVWYGEVDPKFVQATLYLLGKIASVISSPIVVQKFVSLLCPIENKRLSIFFMNVMNTLNSIVSSTLKKPESFIPIKSSNVIRYSSQSLIDTGLTFYTWIYIEEVIPKYKSILMRIDFDVNKFLCLYIDGDKLIINLQDFDELIALDAGKIPFRSWCFVSFTLDFNDNCGNPIDLLKLSTYINYNIGKIFQIPMHDFLKESLSISFNGTFHDPCEIAANPVYPLTPIVHGPIYLFAHPLTETQILTTYTQGPLRSKISIYSKIIPEFGYIPPFTSETYNTTLSSILVYQFKLNILIPLFSLYDFQTDNFQVIVDASIELISNSLLVSEEAEIDFANAHGFDVIYHLLLQYSPKFINYAMYKKFFTLLQMLRTDKLQQQLIEAILANNELWIIADNDSQLSILKHWSKTLFSTVVSSIPFSDLLNMFIMYYWNKPAKKYLLKGLPGSPRPRADKLNIFECQKIFGDVLLQVSKYNFSDDDLTFLIGHIMNCNDEHQVFILMNLIKKIIINTETNESLRNTLIKFDFISFTRRMIKHKSDQAVFKTLEITILLHQKKLITSLRLQTNMNLFYFESPKMYLKSKIFDKLIKNQYHKIPEIFNMLIFMATNLSDEKFLYLLKAEKPILDDNHRYLFVSIIRKKYGNTF